MANCHHTKRKQLRVVGTLPRNAMGKVVKPSSSHYLNDLT